MGARRAGRGGLGLTIYGLLTGRRDDLRGGLGALVVGIVIFLVGFLFFEGVIGLSDGRFGNLTEVAVPLLIVGIGVVVLVGAFVPGPWRRPYVVIHDADDRASAERGEAGTGWAAPTPDRPRHPPRWGRRRRGDGDVRGWPPAPRPGRAGPPRGRRLRGRGQGRARGTGPGPALPAHAAGRLVVGSGPVHLGDGSRLRRAPEPARRVRRGGRRAGPLDAPPHRAAACARAPARRG